MNLQFSDDLIKKITKVPFKKKQSRTGYASTYADDLKLLHELQVQQLEMEMQTEELRVDQRSLEQLNEMQHELLEFAPNGYISLTNTGYIHEVNITGSNLLGISKDQILNRLFLNFIHSVDQEIFKVCWFNLIETRDYQVFNVRLFRPYGHQIYVRIALSIIDFKNEFQVLLAMTDVTMLKQVEDAQSFLLGCSWAKSGKDFFKALAEYLSDSLGIDYVEIDKVVNDSAEAQSVAVYCDGHIKENIRYKIKESAVGSLLDQKSFCYFDGVSSLFPDDVIIQQIGAESITGVTLWGSEGKPIGIIVAIGRKPLTDSRLIDMILKLVSIRAAAEMEHRHLEDAIIRSRDELEVLVRERTAELEKLNEQLRNEIFVRKQQEEALVIAQEKYRIVADFTYNWETWMNPDGEFVYHSPSCRRITGYSVEEFMQDSSLIIQIVHPEDREMVRENFSNLQNDRTSDWSSEFRIITSDGEERWIGHHCQPVYDVNGKFMGHRGSNSDITHRKNQESVLLDSQKRLRQLTQWINEITEDERIRIAREIHDELGHLLTALKYDIDELINQSDLSLDLVKSELVIMMGMIDSLIDSVRKIATELRPGILDHLGLFPAIEWQIRQFRLRTKMCCVFNQSEMDVTFDKDETTIIYRILQEILTNITRHSKANHVKVVLTKNENDFILKVMDNGIGFELDETNKIKSLGLMGMQERALSIGGKLQIDSSLGQGTNITFRLPKAIENYATTELYNY